MQCSLTYYVINDPIICIGVVILSSYFPFFHCVAVLLSVMWCVSLSGLHYLSNLTKKWCTFNRIPIHLYETCSPSTKIFQVRPGPTSRNKKPDSRFSRPSPRLRFRLTVRIENIRFQRNWPISSQVQCICSSHPSRVNGQIHNSSGRWENSDFHSILHRNFPLLSFHLFASAHHHRTTKLGRERRKSTSRIHNDKPTSSFVYQHNKPYHANWNWTEPSLSFRPPIRPVRTIWEKLTTMQTLLETLLRGRTFLV